MDFLFKRRLPFALLLLLALPNATAGQALPPGPQALTYFSTVDDTDQPYALYLPPDFDSSKAYPLVISLHGAGSNHRLNLRRVFGKSNLEDENDVEASRYFPEWEDVDYVVAAPYARGTMGYRSVAERDVLDVLADVRRRFPIDPDRLYLTGLSMGGGGTLWLGLTRPDLWAAIAPVCPAPPPGTEALAPNALHLPTRFFQGAADPVVPAESTRAWVERLDSLGTDVLYDEYEGVGHESWEGAYADGQIFDWFGQFARDPHPERVRFTSDRYEYSQAYWVRLDRLTPGTLAGIDVRFTAPDRIEATTSELGAFTLKLAGHPSFTPGDSLDVRIDGTDVRAAAADSVSFSKREGTWTAERYEAPEGAKRSGLEGPVGAALSGRHIYVYGTADDPSEGELAARQAEAIKAATWSVYRGPFWGRVMVFPRVVADGDVRPSDLESANLVLLGTRETNALVERFADRLPLHLADTTGAYGLVYAFPVGDRYALVHSGRPWWTSASEGRGAPSPFVHEVPALQLLDLPDYRLFEGPLDSVVVEGRFDADWQLPPADAERLRATGVVTVEE